MEQEPQVLRKMLTRMYYSFSAKGQGSKVPFPRPLFGKQYDQKAKEWPTKGRQPTSGSPPEANEGSATGQQVKLPETNAGQQGLQVKTLSTRAGQEEGKPKASQAALGLPSRQLLLKKGASYTASLLPLGSKSITIFGQADTALGQSGTRKSMVGDILVSAQLVASHASPAASKASEVVAPLLSAAEGGPAAPCGSPFVPSRTFPAEAKWVASAFSEAISAYVTDTPALTLAASDDKAQKHRLSDSGLQSFLHVVNTDGGYLLWVVPSVDPTSETRKIAKALKKLLPSSWPSRTMVVSTRPLREDLPDLEGVEEEERSALAAKFADMHDKAALEQLNKCLKDLKLEFENLSTFVPGHSLFTDNHVAHRVVHMISQQDPLPCNCANVFPRDSVSSDMPGGSQRAGAAFSGPVLGLSKRLGSHRRASSSSRR